MVSDVDQQLVERLRAAMDWVEKRARLVANAYGARWEFRDSAIRVYGSTRANDGTIVVSLAGPPVPGGICHMILDHVNVHSPERELRRVAADRRILDQLVQAMDGDYAPWNAQVIATLAEGYGVDEDSVLAALGVDTAVVELADAMRAALRQGHNLEPDPAVLGDPPLRVWACSRCTSPVIWRAGSTSLYDGAARWSCADSLRGDLAQGIELEPAALAWLTEHDRAGADHG